MKLYQHTIFLLLCNFTTLSSQGNNSNGVQSDLRLVDLYENIKNKIGKKTFSNQKIKGTPYFDKTLYSLQGSFLIFVHQGFRFLNQYKFASLSFVLY